MKAILTPFLDAIKHLRLVGKLPDYFDPDERRLVGLGEDDKVADFEMKSHEDGPS